MLDIETNAFLADALDGLTAAQKTLPPKWFYDHRGSALFEEITRLPEYYPTRVETGILRAHAAELAGLVPQGGALVELGAGAGQKTRLLLDQGAHFGAYAPVDISETYLAETCQSLRARYPGREIVPIVGDFLAPVAFPTPVRDMEKVGFFPGSTIGNLSEDEALLLLGRARHWPGMRAFILGADLVKPIPDLVAAYDDSAGVTAAFNLNMLARMQRELGADVDLGVFRHAARWNAQASAIEMHLVAQEATFLELAGHRIGFEAGESIHTESCRKYTTRSLTRLASRAGWSLSKLVTDEARRFAVAILV